MELRCMALESAQCESPPFWDFSSAPHDEGESFDDRKDTAWHADLPRAARERYDTVAGRPIDDWDPAITVKVVRGKHASEAAPDILFGGSVFFVSDRFREVTGPLLASSVQFLPIIAAPSRCSLPRGPYWMMNIIRLVDCIDLAASRARETTSGYRFGTMYPMVDASRIPRDAHALRIRYYSVVALASEQCRQVVRSEGLTGGGFTRWRFWANEGGTDAPRRDGRRE